VWACGRGCHHGSRTILLERCDRHAAKVSEFQTRELAATLWGCAQLQLASEPLLDAAGSRLRRAPRPFSTREVVSMLHSLTKLKHAAAKKSGVYHVGLDELLSAGRAPGLNTQARFSLL
jgi:mevalonate kinase